MVGHMVGHMVARSIWGGQVVMADGWFEEDGGVEWVGGMVGVRNMVWWDGSGGCWRKQLGELNG